MCWQPMYPSQTTFPVNMEKNNTRSNNCKVLVIGSGLSAYGACLALMENPVVSVTVIDIGLEKSYLGQPNYEVPNSTSYKGSNFVYGLNDDRWPVKLITKRMCSSHAIGGFAKVYSGSILKPRDSDMHDWPLESRPTAQDYNTVLSSLYIWQQEDELHKYFSCYPIVEDVEIEGNTYIGAPRLALSKIAPKEIPFDPADDFRKWSEEGRITYMSNSYVLEFESTGNKVLTKIQQNSQVEALTFDRIYIGAGCINTTSIVDRSLFGHGSRTYKIKMARIILLLYLQLPCRRREVMQSSKVRSILNDDLCKIFMEHRAPSTKNLWSHTQINNLNSTILDTILRKLPYDFGHFLLRVRGLFKFSISVFHSKLGPESTLVSQISQYNANHLKQFIDINENCSNDNMSLSLSIARAILSKFYRLYLLPLPLSHIIADMVRGNRLGGWHYGGTLPMTDDPRNPTDLKTNGELNGAKNVFVIDASGFPSIPGGTVALLTMANAYRIAKRSLIY